MTWREGPAAPTEALGGRGIELDGDLFILGNVLRGGGFHFEPIYENWVKYPFNTPISALTVGQDMLVLPKGHQFSCPST